MLILSPFMLLQILHTGGYEYRHSGHSGETYYDDVLEYDYDEQVWTKIGVISQKKKDHAVSVINFNSIKDYCN